MNPLTFHFFQTGFIIHYLMTNPIPHELLGVSSLLTYTSDNYRAASLTYRGFHPRQRHTTNSLSDTKKKQQLFDVQIRNLASSRRPNCFLFRLVMVIVFRQADIVILKTIENSGLTFILYYIISLYYIT